MYEVRIVGSLLKTRILFNGNEVTFLPHSNSLLFCILKHSRGITTYGEMARLIEYCTDLEGKCTILGNCVGKTDNL